MTTTTTERPIINHEDRSLRPDYFDRRDSLLASGAFTIEDRRETHQPTGRRYAE